MPKIFLESKNRRSPDAGFTLLEVIIAMAIMVLAFSSILAVEQGSINASGRAKLMNVVGMLARNQMVETEFKFQGKTFDEVKKEESGTFPAPYEEYKWKSQIKEIKFPNLAALQPGGGKGGDAGGGGGGGSADGQGDSASMIGKLLTKFLTDAMREVTVTITWKRGPGEQNFTLSTFWVNLNSEFKTSE